MQLLILVILPLFAVLYGPEGIKSSIAENWNAYLLRVHFNVQRGKWKIQNMYKIS